MGIVVIGLGSLLRGDDAAGLEAVRIWQARYPASTGNPLVRVELAELPGLALLDLLAGADSAIIVDALRSQSLPGTIRCFDSKALPPFLAGSGSAHGWGVAETLALGRKLKPHSLPARIIVFGIEGADFSIGSGLSPAVTQALPLAIKQLDAEVRRLIAS